MDTNCTGGDYEFTSELWHGKLCLKQVQYFKLTLAKWLDQGL
jgi:hypothetical protein